LAELLCAPKLQAYAASPGFPGRVGGPYFTRSRQRTPKGMGERTARGAARASRPPVLKMATILGPKFANNMNTFLFHHRLHGDQFFDVLAGAPLRPTFQECVSQGKLQNKLKLNAHIRCAVSAYVPGNCRAYLKPEAGLSVRKSGR
jgi:hypothetical protein